MAVKTFVELYATLLLTYIAIGDIVLPQPYSGSSKQFRNDINHFIVSLLPPTHQNFLLHHNQILKKQNKGS
jgi:hypothetical protein